jgi:hypothetical protein
MILQTHGKSAVLCAVLRPKSHLLRGGCGPLLPRRMRAFDSVHESGAPVPTWESPADRAVDRPADDRRPTT